VSRIQPKGRPALPFSACAGFWHWFSEATWTTRIRQKALRLPCLLLLLAFSLSTIGCGLSNRIVARAATGYLREGAIVFQQEADPKLAEQAIPANFKLLEILVYRNPKDRRLLSLAAEYIATYAYAFIEPKIELVAYSDPPAAEEALARASAFYLRGRDYGLRALEHRAQFIQSLKSTPEALKAGLETLSIADLPALFWTGFCWGSWVNLNLNRPEALADSGLITALMARALELDETYYYGGAHLFFGAVLAQLPKSAGGNPQKSREHFERALDVSQNRLLMTKVYFARYYAVRVQDRALFSTLLEEVLQADLNAAPDERLANTLAPARARFYLETAREYFLAP